MHLAIDFHSGAPVSNQILEQIKYLVIRGDLAPGEQIPSVRGLAAQLNLNPTTVARVYKQLESEGVIYTQPGRGAFIADRGSGLTAAEKRRRLAPDIRRLVVEAGRLGLEFPDLLALVEQEIQHITAKGDDRS